MTLLIHPGGKVHSFEDTVKQIVELKLGHSNTLPNMQKFYSWRLRIAEYRWSGKRL